MAVTHAVVLAAGRGSRLGALTSETPKPLLDVGGQPMLLRVLKALAGGGMLETVVVVGYLGDHVRQRIGSGVDGMPIRFIEQPAQDGTARAVSLARDWLPGAFFFAFGDILVDIRNYAAVLGESARRPGAHIIAVNRVDDPAAGAAVYVDEDSRVTRLVEKPPPGTSSTPWNNAGFGVLQPSIWAAIDALHPSARGEYELPEAIASLIERGETVMAIPVLGPWFDAGTPETLADARDAFAVSQSAQPPMPLP